MIEQTRQTASGRAAPPGTRPDRPLRVLQVAGTAVGGDWFHDQVAGLARRGHTVRTVLPDDGPLARRLRASGIPVDVIPFSLTRRLRELRRMTAGELRLARLIRRFSPDVIHA